MRRRRTAVRATALAALVGLAGAAMAAPAAAQERERGPVPSAAGPAWGPCPADVVAPLVDLRCAPVTVPLDHREPGGEQIQIMVSRAASPKPEKRRGVLMLNQGGPGGSGLAFVNDLVKRGLPANVQESYDIIGFDTRGVGHSAPVSCGFTTDQDYTGNIPPYAADDAAVSEQAAIAKDVAQRCAAHDRNGHLRHVSTANVARDMDRIRAALGEEKISFLGFSYGSALGAAYASLFPGRTDRVVLDSNVGDTHLDQGGIRRYGLGAEETFGDFARWAADRHGTYGLGATPEAVRATYFSLAARLDETPSAGIDGRVFRLATFAGLYGPTLYGVTAATWQSLLTGGTAPAPVPPPGPSPSDTMFSAFIATTCNDVAWPRDVESYRRAVAQDRERYPVFGAAAANVLPCAFWPHPPAEPPVAVSGEGPANVLIVQNRHDPVTPLRGGQLLDEKFGDRSRLLVENGSGHGVYVGVGDSACALDTTTAFLVGGPLPPGDVTCG
ncbi:alpha/beta hydrolase family protein [Pseudonocardia sediminis]|uniref:Alpha/beta hydrolase family protein n=1 Tax=Pseudonocardia sediminis TaxID=1397368 RepID=A0A4Q7V2P6_PSEST|nr:alpha/beta hydrolase [Pseudonocardia sediminis]RZT86913.1 alpha/beta hydrolase family protein [Pseudonocardia sediminis]